MSEIRRLDFVGVPSQDADRARAFYRDTLGLRPDEHAEYGSDAPPPLRAARRPRARLVRNEHRLAAALAQAADRRLAALGVDVGRHATTARTSGACARSGVSDPGGGCRELSHQAVASGGRQLNSLSRLWAAITGRHSVRQGTTPRLWNRSILRFCLTSLTPARSSSCRESLITAQARGARYRHTSPRW